MLIIWPSLKVAFLFTFLLMSCNSIVNAQINFEPGHYIDNDGNEVKCLIKDVEWKHNPTKIHYKLSEKAKPQTIDIESIQEFHIYSSYKYIKTLIKLDLSSQHLNYIGKNRDPEWSEPRHIFLKILVEGAANLYYYEENGLKLFYYKMKDGSIEPLVHKKYYTADNLLATNDYYKQQLLNSFFDCIKFNQAALNNTAYKLPDLKKVFLQYNNCGGAENQVQKQTRKSDIFHVSLRPGANFTTAEFRNSIFTRRNYVLVPGIDFRASIEVELILPFHKGKWAAIMEPAYSKSFLKHQEGSPDVTLNLSILEIPVGARHYFFLNKHNAVFINSSIVYNETFNSYFHDIYQRFTIYRFLNFSAGIGFRTKRLSMEGRYYSNQDLLGAYAPWHTKSAKASLILGYKIF